jgi:hypothetical protein
VTIRPALREAGRVVRAGGLVFTAGISRFASRFVGLARGFLFDPEFRRVVHTDLQSGRPPQRNITGRTGSPRTSGGYVFFSIFNNVGFLKMCCRRLG